MSGPYRGCFNCGWTMHYSRCKEFRYCPVCGHLLGSSGDTRDFPGEGNRGTSLAERLAIAESYLRDHEKALKQRDWLLAKAAKIMREHGLLSLHGEFGLFLGKDETRATPAEFHPLEHRGVCTCAGDTRHIGTCQLAGWPKDRK